MKGGRAGELRDELLLLSWCRFLVEANVGCAFIPVAQSGRAGNGCFEGDDINVRRDDVELADDDCVICFG